MSRPATSDHLVSLKKPRLSRVWICNDEELSEEYEEAQEALDLARRRAAAGDTEAKATVDQLDMKVRDLKPRVREASVCWRFKSIGGKAYEKLVAEYPPSQKQIDEHVRGGGEAKNVEWDPDLFPKALIYTSMYEPEMDISLDDFIEWMSGPDWNQGEVLALFTGALEANTRVRTVNLGNG